MAGKYYQLNKIKIILINLIDLIILNNDQLINVQVCNLGFGHYLGYLE
jgi:hypothetical protein